MESDPYRSEDLGQITDDDVIIEETKHRDPRSVTEQLILKLVEIDDLKSHDFENYQARNCLINEQKAKAYIQKLLAAKNEQSL